nr:hypothetical protein [Acidobacteriota bacterium]
MRKCAVLAAGVMALFCLSLVPARPAGAQDGAATRELQAVSAFEGRAKAYSRLREGLEEKLPKLPK